jgi:sterol desaturase/sphingolipid hydroxylase (fatty acid hydroxylase superfamily)
MSLFAPLHLGGLAIAPTWLALGLLLVLAVAEAIFTRARGRHYDLRDAASNLAMYTGHLAILFLWVPGLFVLYDAAYKHALFDLGRESSLYARSPWLLWGLLVLVEDLCFYLFHRASHRVRLLWVSHENHHSSAHFNFTVALRQTWTPFSAAVFWLPLMLCGFEPLMVLAVQTASLAYQAFLHTELGGSFGPLGWILNSPAHHRVHHAIDEKFLDKNFGGVFIFWDRLFGTFQSGVPTHCGIGELRGFNPLSIAFQEWKSLVVDVARSRSLGDALSYFVRPPGWQPSLNKGMNR